MTSLEAHRHLIVFSSLGADNDDQLGLPHRLLPFSLVVEDDEEASTRHHLLIFCCSALSNKPKE
jgi:hypothetical protein